MLATTVDFLKESGQVFLIMTGPPLRCHPCRLPANANIVFALPLRLNHFLRKSHSLRRIYARGSSPFCVWAMATLRYEPCPQFINVSQRALHICWQFSAMSHAIHKIVSKNAANPMINFLFSFVVSPHTFWHRPPGPHRPWNGACYGSIRNSP